MFENVQLPPFNAINMTQLPQQLEQLLNESREVIQRMLRVDVLTWDSLMQPLEDMQDKIDCFWSPISQLDSVVNSPNIRKVYQPCLEQLIQFETEVQQNEKLFVAIQGLANSDAYKALDIVKQKVIQDEIRDFNLSGVHLDKDKKKRFAELEEHLGKLSNQFGNNMLDATKAWTYQTDDENELTGLPSQALDAARQAASEREQSGYVLTLEYPSYFSVMTYADSTELRKKMHTAFVTRASDQGPNAGQWDNSDIMAAILTDRQELASLLDYPHYAEYALIPKMVENSHTVENFLSDLLARAKPQAEREFQALEDFAKEYFGVDQLAAWDVTYFSEKYRQHLYDYSEEDLREYFPEHEVIQGLFDIVKQLFAIDIRQVKDTIHTPTWHSDVDIYALYDEQERCRGLIYFDLYARPDKSGGAWLADGVLRRRLPDDSVQVPIAFLTCNFRKPVGDSVALFTHDDVITLFHEFGHGLHHLLSNVDHASVSGTNGVERDAVELPSQLLENWAWERDGLHLFAKHYQTGEVIPEALFEKIVNAKNFQSAMHMVRQLEFALFDFRCHQLLLGKVTAKDIQACLDAIREKVAVVPIPTFNRFQHGFSHVFDGGYQSAYYGYYWAEVLSCDVFAKFEEQGILNAKVGKEFLNKILERGGSASALELFKDFMGREPTIDAFLKHKGVG